MFRAYSSSILIIYESNDTHVTVENSTEHDSKEYNDVVNDMLMSSDSLVKQNAIQGSGSISEDTELEAKCTDTERLPMACLNCVNSTDSLLGRQIQKPTVSTHLVDFAHTYIGNYNMPDDNYLYGLDNLIQYFELVR